MTNGNRALGDHGEALAARWYTERGYAVEARNWRVTAGEIDLVLRRGYELVFCEVKTRRSERFGLPAEAVTPAKQQRIRRVAAAYLAQLRPAGRCVVRFDVAAVTGRDVEVIEQAF